jgi:hypothetical protein
MCSTALLGIDDHPEGNGELLRRTKQEGMHTTLSLYVWHGTLGVVGARVTKPPYLSPLMLPPEFVRVMPGVGLPPKPTGEDVP